ncbi:MAG: hypothetical protein V1736_05865 [Pseudomonadota bacterium]
MKRLIVLILCILFLATEALAQPSISARGSGAFTSSQVVVARAARLSDLGVQTDGTAAVTVLLYDNATAATGKVIAFAYVPAGSTVGGWNCPIPVYVAAGIYAAVSGTGITRIIVSFDPQ